jgi:beta-xylosidase
MIEAAMIWNEPNNMSHWDRDLDPDWSAFAEMAKLAGQAIRSESRSLLRVMGGISPLDAGFIERLAKYGALAEVDVVGAHGFPLDWNHWQLDEWPTQLAELRAVTSLPVWVTEVGVSTFGAEEVQDFGLRRTAQLLNGQTERIYWYSLLDLPRAWPATTRHREAEGSSYYRHFYMGLVREDGQAKRAVRTFRELDTELGICQWFHFEDERFDLALHWLEQLGVKKLRTGLSWADSLRPNALAWFDRQMKALEPFDVTITFCFTPESEGLRPHHTSPPRNPRAFADFCAAMVRRYAA